MKTSFRNILATGILAASVTAGFNQPIITQQPQDQTNIVGTTATFTVSATSPPDPAYQWQKFSGSWTNLTDRTNATLVLSNVQTRDAADYRAVVTNPDGAITQPREQSRLVCIAEFPLQSREDLRKQSQRPAPLKELVRCALVPGFEPIPRLRVQRVER